MSTDSLTAINPLPHPLCGTTRVPGDKSISHRAVLFSAMAEGVSHISGVLDSADVRSSLGAVRALGAKVDVEVQPDGSIAGTIEGWGQVGPSQPEGPIDCGNSGTTSRLLMGLLAPWPIRVELFGDDSLQKRPMKRITGPLSLMGAHFEPEGKDTLPLVECGGALHAVDFDAPVASAQLKTAMLLAGAFAEGTTHLSEPHPSRNHTELMLPGYGVAVESSTCHASITGPCIFRACDVTVPGDPSSAAFLASAAVLKEGSDLSLENVSLNPARVGFVSVLQRMGARVSVEQTGAQGGDPFGTIRVLYSPQLDACVVDADEIGSMVDEIPVLALVAAHANGVTVFHEVGELRVKETDRLQAIIDGLTLLGVRAWAEGNDLYVEGLPNAEVPSGIEFDSRGDHRLAMTWSLVGLTGSVPVVVRDFESVRISFPSFLTDMERLAR